MTTDMFGNELLNSLLLSKLINWREEETGTEVRSRGLSNSILVSLDKIRTDQKIEPFNFTKMKSSSCFLDATD